MKKLISIALAVFMLLSLTVVAFANTSGTIDTVSGTITVNNITVEDGKPTATYAIYQLLKLNSYDSTTGSYFYAYNADWEDFFVNGEGKNYITVDDKGLIVWVGGTDAARVEAFASLALAYAEANGIDPTKDTTATPAEYKISGSSIVFENLELGYYLVDSSVGALCGLSTTNPNGIINSKNGVPTIDKQVQEDLTEQWGDVNSADIGQTVNFRTTIHVHDGAQNYVLHDIMEGGLTFDPASVVVTLVNGGNGAESTIAMAGNYEVITTCGDGCTFEVKFSTEFCNNLNTNDRLRINYSAMLNRNADIGNGSSTDVANENKTYLTYGEDHYTTEDGTTTKTYGLDLVKTDGQNKLLDGAEFKIYSEEVGGTEVTFVPLLDDADQPVVTDDGYAMYRKARADETGVTIVVNGGKVRIVGLDNGIYWLEETKAPDGYNAIAGRQKFTVSDNNLDAIIIDGIVSTNSGVQVVNHTGSMLPETGATGTALFITFGMIVVLATGVLLVTKKRMSMIQD